MFEQTMKQNGITVSLYLNWTVLKVAFSITGMLECPDFRRPWNRAIYPYGSFNTVAEYIASVAFVLLILKWINWIYYKSCTDFGMQSRHYQQIEVNLYKSQYQKYLFGRSGILLALVLCFLSDLETCHVPISPCERVKKRHFSC